MVSFTEKVNRIKIVLISLVTSDLENMAMACLNWGLLTVESMAAVASPPDSPCSLAGNSSFILDMKSGFSSRGLMTLKETPSFYSHIKLYKRIWLENVRGLDVLTSPVIPTDRSTAGSFDPPAPNPSAPAGTLMPVKPSTKLMPSQQ